MIIEVMGRYAGWLALYSGVAGGGDVILLPEIPYDISKICASILARHRRGKRFSIVVAAEGARPKGGRMTVKKVIEKSTDKIRLGGVANILAKEIEKRTKIESRATILGHLQRGGSPSPFDRVLATRYGTEAVELAVRGKFGHMVALKGQDIVAVPIKDVVNKQKRVPLNHPIIKTARSVGTHFGD
ncbi:6-phosphofructokinase, partial [Candidatus Omnitrophota bacterium]